MYSSYNFDITFNEYEKFKFNEDVKKWMLKYNPILIGVGNATYCVERMTNYERKYLISPPVRCCLQQELIDKENTYCLFGNNEDKISEVERFKERYDKVFTNICDGELGFVEAMAYINCFLSPDSLFCGLYE